MSSAGHQGRGRLTAQCSETGSTCRRVPPLPPVKELPITISVVPYLLTTSLLRNTDRARQDPLPLTRHSRCCCRHTQELGATCQPELIPEDATAVPSRTAAPATPLLWVGPHRNRFWAMWLQESCRKAKQLFWGCWWKTPWPSTADSCKSSERASLTLHQHWLNNHPPAALPRRVPSMRTGLQNRATAAKPLVIRSHQI